jgi:glycosyltransferase involved in cell wall biosynthesis
MEKETEHRTILLGMPAYNEAKTVGQVIEKAKCFVGEILVYDDGSTDDTSRIATDAGATVIRGNRKRGYGYAIKTLFQVAKIKEADILLIIDSDGQHNPDEIPLLLEPILNGKYDIVIGSRFSDGKHGVKMPNYRRIGIRTITKLTNAASYKTITDAQSGFRAYSARALSMLTLSENGMSVSTEILIRAKDKDLAITEVPITANYSVFKPSTQHPFSHGISVLVKVLQFMSLRHPLLFYGLTGIILLGLAAFYANSAIDLYSRTQYISTNKILLSVGLSVLGITLISTAVILYSIINLIKGRIKDI